MKTNLLGFFIFGSLLFNSLQGQAASLMPESGQQGCCVCLTGDSPSWQKGFFKKGCKMWLKEQKGCTEAKIEEVPDIRAKPKTLSLAQSCQGNVLKLGFVGHWASAKHSAAFLQRTLVPTMLTHRLNIDFDNTACNGLDFPEYFKRIYHAEKSLGELSPYSEMGKTLKVDATKFDLRYKANQVVSVGMWDRITGQGSLNFDVFFNGKDRSIQYPACESFEGKTCYLAYQHEQGANCQTQPGSEKKLKRLTCCPSRSSSSDDLQNQNSDGIWSEGPTCQQ